MTAYAKAIKGTVYHQLRDNPRPDWVRKSLCGVVPNDGWGTTVATRPEHLCGSCVAVIGDFFANRFDEC